MKPSKHTKPAKIIFRNGFSPRAYQTYLELVIYPVFFIAIRALSRKRHPKQSSDPPYRVLKAPSSVKNPPCKNPP